VDHTLTGEAALTTSDSLPQPGGAVGVAEPARAIKVQFTNNPRIRPLVDGRVKVPGVTFDWDLTGSSNFVFTHVNEAPFDLFEYSIAGYVVAQQSGVADRLGWTALPVFLSRPFGMFVGGFVVPEGSPIRGLRDLRGTRLGIPEYRMTAGVWLRVMLRELYGISSSEITWVNDRPMRTSYMANLGALNDLPPGEHVEDRPEGTDLIELVRNGEVDAACTMAREASGVRALLDEAATEEILVELKRKIDATPANHLIVVKKSVLRERPELARLLYDAFEESKAIAYRDARTAALGYLYFPGQAFAQQAARLGDDPYPSGISANRATLNALVDQVVADRQVATRPALEKLFAPGLEQT